jgi:hypothetical protein
MTAGLAVPDPPVVFRNNAMGARGFSALAPQATN